MFPGRDQGEDRPYLNAANPRCQPALIKESDYTIVATFGTRYRGIVQYYLLAQDVFRLDRLDGSWRHRC